MRARHRGWGIQGCPSWGRRKQCPPYLLRSQLQTKARFHQSSFWTIGEFIEGLPTEVLVKHPPKKPQWKIFTQPGWGLSHSHKDGGLLLQSPLAYIHIYTNLSLRPGAVLSVRPLDNSWMLRSLYVRRGRVGKVRLVPWVFWELTDRFLPRVLDLKEPHAFLWVLFGCLYGWRQNAVQSGNLRQPKPTAVLLTKIPL